MSKFKYASNSQLAKALDCHLTAASRLRSGRRRPSLDMAVRVVEAFELTGAKAYDAIKAMQQGGSNQAAMFDQHVGGWVPPVAKPKPAKVAKPAKTAPKPVKVTAKAA